jgi:MFS family permease
VDEPSAQAPGYLALLRANSGFRTLYVARLISLLGDWFNTFAILALLRRLEGDGDASDFGWVIVLKTLPVLLVTPFAGVLVDRLSRKGILVATDLCRAVVLGLMLGLEQLGGGVGALYGLVALQTSFVALSEPARNAVLPDLVRRADLVTANALNAVTWSLVFTGGTALGGLVTDLWGPQTALAVDLGTYLVSALLLVGLPLPHRPKAGIGPAGLLNLTGIADFVEGARYLLARPAVLTLALAKFGWSLAGAITLVITILGERRFTMGANGLLGVTALYMARGVGTALGPILSRRICGASERRAERIIGVGYLVGAIFYLPLGWADELWLAMLLLLLAHIGGATVWVFSTVRLQAQVPTEVRGRVFAFEQAGFTLAMALSTLVYGHLIDTHPEALGTLASSLGLVMLFPAGCWLLRDRLVPDAAAGDASSP